MCRAIWRKARFRARNAEDIPHRKIRGAADAECDGLGKFAAATGADDSAFATVEGITETARQYYEWTDAQTPDIPDDGKAFLAATRLPIT